MENGHQYLTHSAVSQDQQSWEILELEEPSPDHGFDL